MAISKEWQNFLREQFPTGSRIVVREMADGQNGIAPGTAGTLRSIDEDGMFHILLKDGAELGLLIGTDRFSVEPPEAQTVKLFFPLTADLYERDEWGDLCEEPVLLDGHSLREYEGVILKALRNNTMPEEAESGLMHWYGEDDGVNRKVRSAVFTLEERNGRLWGVAECRVTGELTPEELDTLKDYVTGQAADGWGEGFEQREIKVNDGVMYVHLWNSDNWSIQTEQEQFAPKLAESLPDLCWSVMPSSGELICIKRGESGYYPSDWSTDDRQQNREIADAANEQRGVTPAQEQAMLTGSMFGWQSPGADPKWHEIHAPQMGGQTFG